MNKEFAITWAGGKAVILREHLDIQFNRQAVDFVRKEDMTTFYANEYVDVSRADGQPKYKPLALWWLQHRQRRTYPTGIIFNPKHTQRGAFNLWRGFAVAPDPSGSCECYKQHLREVICSNNDEWFRWLWAWLAQLAQDPTRRPGTCVVQRGAEGVGKGLWVIYLGLIFGRHFVHVQGARQLVGNFNKHLADAVVVFGDEAFFAGNKDHVGVLKAIITEPVTMCEPKFHDAFPVANHKWLIIASNEDWVFPAGITARRPLMLDVATTRRGDTAHFDALGAEMKAGGPGRLLHELLAFDLATCATSGINLRDPPKTAALIEQKQMSMSGTDRFWEERLREGSLLPYQVAAYGEAGSDDTRTPDVQRRRWEDPVHRDRAWVHGQKLYQAYLEAARGLNERHPVGVEIFWSNLRRWLPDDGIHNLRFRPNGIKHESPLQFKGFPPLGRCRKLFEKVLGQAIDWDQGELEEDDLDEPSF